MIQISKPLLQISFEMAKNGPIFGNVYICAWIARWDCLVHSLLCQAVKLYAQSDVAKMIASGFIARRFADDAGTVIYTRGPEGHSRWHLHRTDGPACEWVNGNKEWWVNNKRHRIDGPAIGNSSPELRYKEWWVYNIRHRTDGPAVEHPKGAEEWWVNGERHRIDGPAIVAAVYKEWWVDGKRHRIDGPAVEDRNYKAWWVNDKRHRIDGPAILWEDGSGEWWIDGVRQFALEGRK